jgi:hypothetical protein
MVPKKKKKSGGWPQKKKVVEDINEVINELLTYFEITDGEDENLFYDANEVNKEKDGTFNWWDNIDCNISEKGANIGDQESDDESDGLARL